MKDFENRRAKIVKEIPDSYNMYVHLAVPSLIVLAVLVCSILFMGHFSFVTAGITLFLLLGFEWMVHKYVLHHAQPGLKPIYKQHTLHHIIFTNTDMQIRSGRELNLVLMPAYAVVLVFLLLMPITWAVWVLVSSSVALSMLATAMVFFLFYEWMHLAYHLPDSHWLLRSKLMCYLKKQHQTHHDIRLMTKWNFNVTFPLFDWILSTNKKD